MSSARTETEVEGRRLSLSNLDKVLFSEVGFTKGALIDYYARVASTMLPHLAGRAATLRRFPNGVDGHSFYEKHAPAHKPPWVRTAHVDLAHSGRRTKGVGDVEYIVIDDLPTLVWVANLATIEIHVPLWRVMRGKKAPTSMDFLVFDLDPGPGASVVECCVVASWIKNALKERNLTRCVPKTSGSKGLQVYARLPGRTSWESARDAGHDLAARARTRPFRPRFDEHAQTAPQGTGPHRLEPESSCQDDGRRLLVRARHEPTVSTPVTWKEVADCREIRGC